MRVGLLVSHALHDRNWIASGMAQKITDKHDLVVLRPREIGAVGGPWRRRGRMWSDTTLTSSCPKRSPL